MKTAVLFSAAAAAISAAAVFAPKTLPLVIYQGVMAAGVTALLAALLFRNWRPPFNIAPAVFIVLAVLPASLQIGLVKYRPSWFWISPVCFALIFAAARFMPRRDARPMPDAHILAVLNIRRGAYWLAAYALLPVLVWDWRQYPAAYVLWWLVLKTVRGAR